MNTLDPINIMIDLEKKFNLFNIKIRDLKIWYFCRQEINYVINGSINRSKHVFRSTNITKRKVKNNFMKAVSYLNSISLGLNKYKSTDVLCLSNNNMRREIEDGKEFDIIFDYIGKYLKGVNYAILNTFNGKQYSKNGYTKNSYNLTNYCLNIYLYKKYYKLILTKKEISFLKKIFSRVEEYLLKNYNLRVNMKEIVLKNTAALCKSYKYALKVVKKTSPKVLYVECAYSNMHLPFIYAAKNIGIKVVEFQHGVISDKHLGYLYNNDTCYNEPIPDYVCVYGRYMKNLIKSMNSKLDIKIIEYGYPYLYEKSIEVKNHRKNLEYKYLITTQGAVNCSYWSKFIEELLEIDKDSKILVKLHPNEVSNYKDYYKNLLKNERVQFDKYNNLYECFKKSKVHISSFSTCHYEAICCDVDTVVVMFPGWQHVKILKEYGVKFISTPKELVKYLNEEDCNIFFHSFKKDFFNIENDKESTEDVKDRILTINKYFLNEITNEANNKVKNVT